MTDLDNTLVGDPAALMALNQRLSHYRQQYGLKIVYATGRSRTLYDELQTAHQLLVPDALITAVGTEIYFTKSPIPDPTWAAHLSLGWERSRIVTVAAEFPDLIPQPESEQRPFKVSYAIAAARAAEVLPALQLRLTAYDLRVELIYSGGQDLDIVPPSGNKGQAVDWVQKAWGIMPNRTLVCGDSGNDISLFSLDEALGIIVGNAQSELLNWHHEHPTPRHYLAPTFYAQGILAGLNHFGI